MNFPDGFVDFLLAAKRSTYAAGGGTPVPALLPGARQLEFQQGPFFYRDIYFGTNFFAGQEVVYYQKRPLWTMIYAGGPATNANPGETYTFLRQAMAQVEAGRPFRGPFELRQGDWLYRDHSTGNIERFDGEEMIWLAGVRVYRLFYHGGALE